MDKSVWFLTFVSVLLIFIGLPFSLPWYSWFGVVYLAQGVAILVEESMK